ncbi:hypothetical protein B0H21DRAFT_826448 [Amylocystis lapponica]|nr:hypothetical protein B0H21DRAFT_826448 [Amylocystis lapponica]
MLLSRSLPRNQTYPFRSITTSLPAIYSRATTLHPSSTVTPANMADYEPLTQDEGPEKDLPGSSHAHGFSGIWQRFASSPSLVALALALLVGVNILCLAYTTRQLRVLSAALPPHLFTDTRDLPRPDQYEGLDKLRSG